MVNLNPQPNMKIHLADKPGAKSEIGKWRQNLSKFRRDNIPEDLVELYDWYKCIDTKKIDYMLELKNMYNVLKGGILKKLLKKIEEGKDISQTEISQFRLAVDIMEKSHKLKYGDKKIIEHIVSQADIIQHMRKVKEVVVEAEVIDDNRGDN